MLTYDGIKDSQCVDRESVTKNPSNTPSTTSKPTILRQRDNELSTTTTSSVSISTTPSTLTTPKEPTPTPHITLFKLLDNSLFKFYHQIVVIVD